MLVRSMLFLILFELVCCDKIEIVKDIVDINIEDEIRIIQISDLHIQKDKSIYGLLIKTVKENNPDLLLLTGDSIDSGENMDLLEDFLKRLEPDIPKYAVSGNWEHWINIDMQRLKAIYQISKVKLLVNEGESIKIKNQNIYIFGTDDSSAGNPDTDAAAFDPSGINIILTHSPGYFDYLSERYRDEEICVFSGHTHGGQITFFGNPIVVPQGSGKYLKGIYRKNKLRLYVSKGIGNSIHDFRLFADPDIVLVVFK